MAEGQYRYMYRCCRSQTPAGVIGTPVQASVETASAWILYPAKIPFWAGIYHTATTSVPVLSFPEHLGSPDSFWSKDWKI